MKAWSGRCRSYLSHRAVCRRCEPEEFIHVGIAERYDLVVPQAGGPRLQAGDYIHFNGRSSKFSEGAWGILRVLDKDVTDLQKLPAGTAAGTKFRRPRRCPADAPVKSFNVSAIDFPSMKLNPKAPDAIEVDFERTIQMVNPDAKIYVLDEDVATVASGLQPMPLTLRANVGDCLKAEAEQQDEAGPASFSALGLAFDPKDSLGANVGNNPGEQTVAPGESRVYTYYADPFIGETASPGVGLGNVMTNPATVVWRYRDRAQRGRPIAIRRPVRISPRRTAGSPMSS